MIGFAASSFSACGTETTVLPNGDPDTAVTGAVKTEATASPSPTVTPEPFVPELIGRYEAEAGSFTGKVHVSGNSDDKFSGKSYVEGFEGDNDSCSFKVSVKDDGFFDLTFGLMGIGGDKTNFVSLDGEYVGSISVGKDYGRAVLNRIFLSKGEHELTVSKSWGWIYLDYLDVYTSEPIDKDFYMVSKQLSNKNATENTKRLFSYLVDIYGTKILSGQVCDDGPLGGEIQVVHNTTGKYPAILSMDLMSYTASRPDGGSAGKTITYAKNWNEKGGILEFHWHWTVLEKYSTKAWYSSFYTDSTNFSLEKALNGTDKEGYDMLVSDMRAMAEVLKELNDLDIPIIFRPLHEASGGWFWWGAAGAENYKKLYIMMYEMFTDEYKLNNLIWLWNGQDKDWYPGDQYCDILGTDIYPGERVYSSQASKFFELSGWSGVKKPVYLSECGCIFDPDLAVRDGAMWGCFIPWQGEFVKKASFNKLSEQYTEEYMMKKAYESEHVITLDELPDLKTYSLE